MIVPSPTSGVVDFKADGTTETLPCDEAWIVERFSLHSSARGSVLIADPNPETADWQLTDGGTLTAARALDEESSNGATGGLTISGLADDDGAVNLSPKDLQNLG
jgi:hypothetical protein